MDAIENTATINKRPSPGFCLPADVAGKFSAEFLDEDVCRRWILEKIYDGMAISCPQCSALLTENRLRRFWLAERIRCHACGKFFTALTDTFLQGCHLAFREIILLAIFLHFNIHHREIASILRISTETVRLWDIKFSALDRINRTLPVANKITNYPETEEM